MSDDLEESREFPLAGNPTDSYALGELFNRHRDRLRIMVHLRIDRRLRGRVDASDVLQEAYVEALERFPDFLQDRPMPFFLWLRFITEQRLQVVHRRHLGTKARDAGRDISLTRQAAPLVSSESLAAQLVGRHSSPSQAAMRAEMQARLHAALETMNPIDREILALRHFEQLTNTETAQLLGLREDAASQRYGRALVRLKDMLLSIPGFGESTP
jgi:RNA polymerase sigma-70 factor (ECF subfamily)